MRHADDKCNVAPRLQWFNDCTVHFSEILLLHGSGRKLSRSDDRVSAVVSLNWPSGPTATLNAPKWQIRCSVEEIDLNLLREDYTLIQHIIQHNIGEESRHFEEWNALQNLPPLVLQRYKVLATFIAYFQLLLFMPTQRYFCFLVTRRTFAYNSDMTRRM
jgi:hypothetical protein